MELVVDAAGPVVFEVEQLQGKWLQHLDQHLELLSVWRLLSLQFAVDSLHKHELILGLDPLSIGIAEVVHRSNHPRPNEWD